MWDVFKKLRDQVFGVKTGQQLYRRGQQIVMSPVVHDALIAAGVPVDFQGAVQLLAQKAGNRTYLSSSVVTEVAAYVAAHWPASKEDS